MPLDLRPRGGRDDDAPRCLAHDWNCPRVDGDPLVDRGLARMLCEARREDPPPRTGPCRMETQAQVRARQRELDELLVKARAELAEIEAAYLAGGAV